MRWVVLALLPGCVFIGQSEHDARLKDLEPEDSDTPALTELDVVIDDVTPSLLSACIDPATLDVTAHVPGDYEGQTLSVLWRFDGEPWSKQRLSAVAEKPVDGRSPLRFALDVSPPSPEAAGCGATDLCSHSLWLGVSTDDEQEQVASFDGIEVVPTSSPTVLAAGVSAGGSTAWADLANVLAASPPSSVNHDGAVAWVQLQGAHLANGHVPTVELLACPEGTVTPSAGGCHAVTGTATGAGGDLEVHFDPKGIADAICPGDMGRLFDHWVRVTGHPCEDPIDLPLTGPAFRWVTDDCDGDGVSLSDTEPDCDDLDGTRAPGKSDLPYDGVDNNCDTTDEYDKDGDGHKCNDTDDPSCPSGVDGLDCNDDDDSIYPDASETFYDGIDQACNGNGDDNDADGDGIDCAPGVNGCPSGSLGDDCDDGNATLLGATTQKWFADLDNDGYGDPGNVAIACTAPDTYYVLDGTDCNDADLDTHPAATEICDNIDNDCDPNTEPPISATIAGTQYATAQLALDAAVTGDVVQLCGGTFDESLTIDIVGSVTVAAALGHQPVLDGGGRASPVVTVLNGAVTLEDLEITNGTGFDDAGNTKGGGIYARDGQGLVLNRVVVHDNMATDGGGIYARGTTLRDSTIRGNLATRDGGGIYIESGDLDIDRTAIHGNAAQRGGGVDFRGGGTFWIASGTDVYGNNAGDGGGVHLRSSVLSGGGSIYSNTATNGAGLAVAVGGTVVDTQITLNVASGNGGGIWCDNCTSGLSVDASSLQNIAGADGGGLYLSGGTGHTVSGTFQDNSATTGGGGIALANTDATISNAWIRYNDTNGSGGGLLATSSTVGLVDTALDENDAVDDGGGLEAIDATISLTRSTMDANEALSNGGGGELSTSSLTLDSSSTVQGNNAILGGGLFVQDAVVNGGTLSGNTATNHGGGIYQHDGTLTMNGVIVTGNQTTTGDGGGVFSEADAITLDNVDVNQNVAVDDGGGIHIIDSMFAMTGGRVYDNDALSEGGGLKLLDSPAGSTMSGVEIAQNTTADDGGALVLRGSLGSTGNLLIDGDPIGSQAMHDNHAGEYGGGAYIDLESHLQIANATIHLNEADLGGGGFALAGGQLTLTGVDLQFNAALEDGGGLHLTDLGGTVTVDATSVIQGNTAERGGAGYLLAGTIDLNGPDVLDNEVSDNVNTSPNAAGGGFFLESGTLDAADVLFSRNNANGVMTPGGAVMVGGTSSFVGTNIDFVGPGPNDNGPDDVFTSQVAPPDNRNCFAVIASLSCTSGGCNPGNPCP